jgi:tryptophanase
LLAPERFTLSNTHFDTTRADIELTDCQAVDQVCPQARDLDSGEPSKGDIDPHRLEEALRGTGASRIAQVIMTLTDHGEAGQPVSTDNTSPEPPLCAGSTRFRSPPTPRASPRTPGRSPSTRPPTGT